jgi:fructan beta-fructosidase
MSKGKARKWLVRGIVGLLGFQLIAPMAPTAVYAESASLQWTNSYEIINPGFESGDLTGWTVVQGQAFGEHSVSDETTWWAEQIPYYPRQAYYVPVVLSLGEVVGSALSWVGPKIRIKYS